MDETSQGNRGPYPNFEWMCGHCLDELRDRDFDDFGQEPA